MASPQVEDGYTPIANAIIEALWKINLSPYESRVVWYLFRKTYGWNKKTDWIALSQFSRDIGIDRRLVHRAIHSLSSKKMIVIYKDDKGKVTYGFQKNYEKWKINSLSSVEMTVIGRDDRDNATYEFKKDFEKQKVSSVEMTVIGRDDELSSVEIPTKETLTKEKTFRPNSREIGLSELLLSKITDRNPEFKKPSIQKWAVHVDRMIRIDIRAPDEIREVIEWCQEHPFWQNNILSTEKLRKQYDQLKMKMMQTAKPKDDWMSQ